LEILRRVHEYKRLFDGQRCNSGDAPNEVSKDQRQVPGIPLGAERPGFAPCPVCGDPTKNIWPLIPKWVVQPLVFGEPQPNPMSLAGRLRVKGGPGYFMGSECAVCNNTKSLIRTPGFSPSSQDGIWMPEPMKQSGGILDIQIALAQSELLPLQRELGEGDEITTIAKNKVENIGLVMNDLKSFRVDPKGKLRIDGVNVALEGVYATFKTSPHVEYVDVDDVPGGDYNLTCGNKYKLLVGAKGINIKTFGPMDMYGTIVNLIGEQINIASQNEVLIDGGERFNIRARKISLIPIEHQPVVIDGQLHVTRNAIVGGGMFVDGEMGMLHVTAPFEYYTTEPTTGASVTLPNGPESGVSVHSHIIPPHTHMYKHIAVTFLPAREAVRDKMRNQGGEAIVIG